MAETATWSSGCTCMAGAPAGEIAGRLGFSTSLVYRRRGMSAPEIAAAYGVGVSCVCRALDREQLTTNRQAGRQRRRLRYPELYATQLSVDGNAQR